MGKQINFLMDKEFEEKFLQYILVDGILLFEGDNKVPERIKILPKPFSGKGWFSLYLFKEEFADLFIKETKGGIKYIDAIKSPVIEFNRTVIRESAKEISRGRLWVEMKFYNESENLIIKTKVLDDWYKNLSKWIKKNLPKTEIVSKDKTYSEYACESIKNLVENGYRVM